MQQHQGLQGPCWFGASHAVHRSQPPKLLEEIALEPLTCLVLQERRRDSYSRRLEGDVGSNPKRAH